MIKQSRRLRKPSGVFRVPERTADDISEQLALKVVHQLELFNDLIKEGFDLARARSNSPVESSRAAFPILKAVPKFPFGHAAVLREPKKLLACAVLKRVPTPSTRLFGLMEKGALGVSI